jgi:DNA-binding CsgD family transcriptional regulator
MADSAMLAGILATVPSSRWSFARVDPKGELEAVYGSDVHADSLARMTDEYARQRAVAESGSRLAATLGSLDGFASGITLVFADARATFGLLTLLRTAECGPFTSSEIHMLAMALDAYSDRVSELRIGPAERAAVSAGEFYVLDTALEIVFACASDTRCRAALTDPQPGIAERLPTLLEGTVRNQTAHWTAHGRNASGEARPVPFLIVRTRPMWGPAGLHIGVQIDRAAVTNALSGPAARFHISPREVQVLALLLDGDPLHTIAQQLFITPSTVQDHIKSMLDKTESRNRSELIARVLGWESTSAERQA